jgi:predicted PurR-regulated permease PerM
MGVSVEPEKQRAEFLERAVEVTIRVGLVVVLIAWCFQTLRPFLQPALWGMIIAIAAYPGYVRLRRALGGRRGAAATAFALLGLVIIVIPMAVLAGTLADGVGAVAEDLKDGALTIPAPPESVKAWPVVGERVHALWLTASHNIGDVLAGFGPQLRSAGGAVVSAAAGAGLALLEFVAAIIIAAVLMVYADGGERAADAIAVRIAGPRGPEYADLAKLTIRNVTRGILGVALIQALLAGIGFLAIGLPAAGLLALVCLILATIQVGVGPVMIPATIYVFYVNDTLTAVLFAGWTVLVILSDNVLKPILLGRGARVPMLVIFLGAIGGFLASGIIGLFTGAVVLSLGYTLFVAWLNRTPAIEPETPVR